LKAIFLFENEQTNGKLKLWIFIVRMRN